MVTVKLTSGAEIKLERANTWEVGSHGELIVWEGNSTRLAIFAADGWKQATLDTEAERVPAPHPASRRV